MRLYSLSYTIRWWRTARDAVSVLRKRFPGHSIQVIPGHDDPFVLFVKVMMVEDDLKPQVDGFASAMFSDSGDGPDEIMVCVEAVSTDTTMEHFGKFAIAPAYAEINTPEDGEFTFLETDDLPRNASILENAVIEKELGVARTWRTTTF